MLCGGQRGKAVPSNGSSVLPASAKALTPVSLLEGKWDQVPITYLRLDHDLVKAVSLFSFILHVFWVPTLCLGLC